MKHIGEALTLLRMQGTEHPTRWVDHYFLRERNAKVMVIKKLASENVSRGSSSNPNAQTDVTM